MRAARIVETPRETGQDAGIAIPKIAPPEIAAGDAIPVRVASEHDIAAVSPVHAMQAQLAVALDRRPRRRLDPTRTALFVVAMVYTAGAWWGLARLGSMLVHHWIAR